MIQLGTSMTEFRCLEGNFKFPVTLIVMLNVDVRKNGTKVIWVTLSTTIDSQIIARCNYLGIDRAAGHVSEDNLLFS